MKQDNIAQCHTSRINRDLGSMEVKAVVGQKKAFCEKNELRRHVHNGIQAFSLIQI